MIELTTAKQKKKLQVSEDLVYACKPEPSGITRIYFSEGVPNPEREERLSEQLRVKEKPEKLGEKFEKLEEVDTGGYWWVNMSQVLAKLPTEQGFRAYLPGDVSGSSTPFGRRKIHFRGGN